MKLWSGFSFLQGVCLLGDDNCTGCILMIKGMYELITPFKCHFIMLNWMQNFTEVGIF